MTDTWRPSIGAWPESGGTAFRVWAPCCNEVAVVVEGEGGPHAHGLEPSPDGSFAALVPGVRAGNRYRYRLDGGALLPDPASRFQPDGVHGPSQVVDPGSFRWAANRPADHLLESPVFYELHVGAFSPEGTFDGVTARLPELASLGITAVELMPVADFPGSRNWGYDGVALFAPARCYGTPDDLRRLVDTAHSLGLAVVLDVVYNHLGPDGAYLAAFSPYYFTERHHTPWGSGLNFDGEHSHMVRAFFIENACHWVHEYQIDGLRLDATHAIVDDGPRHVLAELAQRLRDSAPSRRIVILAEDHRNLDQIVRAERHGGWGLDAVWADDFHHECRRLLANDTDGYYRDYRGRTEDLATTIRRGWLYTGQFSTHLGAPRGTDSAGIPLNRFVFCLQNHDQIGNRAFGDRLHHQISLAAYRAASVLLLMAPETPLLFMGQEWAATAPFLYFTDHRPDLGRLVTQGRRDEFRHFTAFADPGARARIPNPQAQSTFRNSQLEWEQRHAEPHASTLRLYRALLALRRRERTLRGATAAYVAAPDEGAVAMRRDGAHDSFLIVVRLKGAGVIDLEPAQPHSSPDVPAGQADDWEVILTSEDPSFSPDPTPPEVRLSAATASIGFARPGAVICGRRKNSAATESVG